MKSLTRTTVVVNFVALLAVLVINYLSNSLPLNGKTPGELSDLYPNYFVPAGLTFSIWGIIYTWLIVWTGYQVAALFSKSMAQKMEPIIAKSNPWFLISCLLNILWLFAWHWQVLGLSVTVMIALLLTLVKLNLSIQDSTLPVSKLEKNLAWIPFGIYQGWITVALIANITATLVQEGIFTGSSMEVPIAAMMVAIGALLAIAVLFRQKNIGHGLAVSWALFGIYWKQHILPGSDHQLITYTALAGMAGVLAVTALKGIENYRQAPQA
jgi:benzodiazapine receptor